MFRLGFLTCSDANALYQFELIIDTNGTNRR